jgi:hypothetical protein
MFDEFVLVLSTRKGILFIHGIVKINNRNNVVGMMEKRRLSPCCLGKRSYSV